MSKADNLYYHWYYTDNADFFCTIEVDKGSSCQIRDEKGGFEPDYADDIYVIEIKHKGVDIIDVIHPDVLREIVTQFVESVKA
jgi:hypothetical protein